MKNKIHTHNFFNKKKYIPVNKRVLIKVPILKSKTEGGIYINPDTIEREQRRIRKGELVNFSTDAFEDWKEKPKKGDIVYFLLFTGEVMYSEDDDGHQYRNMLPEEITAFEKSN